MNDDVNEAIDADKRFFRAGKGGLFFQFFESFSCVFHKAG
jgi:hypothetical protein